MTNKQLTTLDRIKLAYSWGWSATMNFLPPNNEVEKYQVIGIDDWNIFIRYEGGRIRAEDSTIINENSKITGYLYMGELGGNEKIPERQRFRVKETGKIGFLNKEVSPSEIWLVERRKKGEVHQSTNPYDKSEIEPVFD